MKKRGDSHWAGHPDVNEVLLSFSSPKTPKQAERGLSANRIKMKPFLEKRLLESLNPDARKGRFYGLTAKARQSLNLSLSEEEAKRNWNLIGWIISSPKQRLVVLYVLDSMKRTSEEIRRRAKRLNSCLSRVSTKSILNELVINVLAHTILSQRKRYYWITKEGNEIKQYFEEFQPYDTQFS